MLVKDIMTAGPACCTKDTSLADVARMMARHDCGAVPVVESDESLRPLGVITDRDIVVRTLADGKDPFEMAAGDCFTPQAVTVGPDDSLEECAGRMRQHQLRRVLVCDTAGRVVGIVAQADLAEHANHRQSGAVLQEVSH